MRAQRRDEDDTVRVDGDDVAQCDVQAAAHAAAAYG
jgi:hypothetical protein